MKKKIVILIFALASSVILISSCQSYVNEKILVPHKEEIYGIENNNIIIQNIEKLSDEDVVNYYVKRYYNMLEIQYIKKGFDISQKDIKSMLKERTSEYSRSLREKWDKMPRSVKEYIRNLVFYDKKIRSNIGFKKLKDYYCKGKLLENNFLNKYKEEAEKVGLFDYIKKLLIQNNISLSSFKKYPLRNIEASDFQNGLHHNDLNLMQPGDVMVNISKSDSSAGSSSTDPISSSNAKFGHAAIWVKKGDPEKYNPYSYVAMSAWSKPKRKYHERNYEVGYDLRECWSGRLSCKNDVIYGMNVRKWISTGWFSGYWKIISRSSKASAAVQYAKNQRGKHYTLLYKIPTTKLSTKTFYCSSLTWRSWYEQGIDLDPKWWPLNQWFITPADIYGDNNTSIKISYSGINQCK